MSPEKLYTRVDGAYRCGVCARDLPSYRALARHQFAPVDPCVTALSDQPPIVPHEVPSFDGDLLPMPQGPTDPDSLSEHRDEFGILRVSGMLTGYRRWSVGRVDGRFRLFPMVHGGSRPYPRGVMSASCWAKWPSGPHASPYRGCGCGLYAAWKPSAVTRHPVASERGLIGGRIKGFGKVFPGGAGWRAEHVIVDTLLVPRCVEPGCHRVSMRGVLRNRWIKPMSPSGRTYPSPRSPSYITYRETADFRGTHALLPYVGWFCDKHGSTEFTEVIWEGRCDFPTGRDERCKQWAQLALKGMRFSWCLEHAPIIVETSMVIEELRTYYDVDAVRRFSDRGRPAEPEVAG